MVSGVAACQQQEGLFVPITKAGERARHLKGLLVVVLKEGYTTKEKHGSWFLNLAPEETPMSAYKSLQKVLNSTYIHSAPFFVFRLFSKGKCPNEVKIYFFLHNEGITWSSRWKTSLPLIISQKPMLCTPTTSAGIFPFCIVHFGNMGLDRFFSNVIRTRAKCPTPAWDCHCLALGSYISSPSFKRVGVYSGRVLHQKKMICLTVFIVWKLI